MYSFSGVLFFLFASLAAAADLYKVLDCECRPVVCKFVIYFLAVHPSASEKDIRHAYKKLSRKYHPDKNKDPAAESKFVEIAHGQPPLSFILHVWC
jgi:DnaJ-related protein SCJ1